MASYFLTLIYNKPVYSTRTRTEERGLAWPVRLHGLIIRGF